MRKNLLYLLAFFAVCSCTLHEAAEQKEATEQKDSVAQIEVPEAEDTVAQQEEALDVPIVVDENALRAEIA